MEKQQIGLITSVVVNVVLAALLIFFIFKLNASSGAVEGHAPSSAARALLAPDLGCINVNTGDALLVIDVQNDFMPQRPYTITSPKSPKHTPAPNDMSGTDLKDGSLRVPAAKDIVSHINPLIDTFEAAKATIIYSLDWHTPDHCSFDANAPYVPVAVGAAGICRDDKSIELLNQGKLNRWPVHCVQGTWGAQFDPHLKISTAPSSFIIKKGFWKDFDSYSAFGGRLSKFASAADTAIVDADVQWEDMQRATKRLTDILKEKKIQRLFIVGIATNYCVKYSLLDARIAEYTEVPGLAIATVKEAIAAAGATQQDADADTKSLLSEWPNKNIAVLSEKNKEGKPLFRTSC